jgi:hypothetical protein
MVRCISGVAKFLNVDRSNMKKAMEMHLQLDTKKDIIWIGQRQAKRYDSSMTLSYNGGQLIL